MSRSTTCCSRANASGLLGHQRHEGPVDVVEHVVDDLVLLLEPVDHRHRVGVAGAQVREDPGVLEAVVPGHDAAVRLAVGAERPVVLAHRHRVDRRPRRTHPEVPAHHLLDDVAHLGQLGAQVVVHVLEVLRHGELGRSVGRLLTRVRTHRIRRPAPLVPRQDAGQPGPVVGRRRDNRPTSFRSACDSGDSQAASLHAAAPKPRKETARHPRRRPDAVGGRGATLAFRGHEVAHQRRHLLAEAAHVVGVVGRQDVGRHALARG